MPSNFYQQYFEAQKTMFDEWQNYMKSLYSKGFGAAEGMSFIPEEYYKKMSEAPYDFWKKANESQKSYFAVFELWQKMSEKAPGMDSKAAMQIYEDWSKQYFSLIRSNFLPHLPEYLKDFTEKFVANMESSNKMAGEYLKVWASAEEPFKQAFQTAMADGPKGYVEFLEVWRKQYDETFGKLMNAPTFGKDMEFWKQQKDSFDRFIKYNIAAARFYASLFDIMEDATRRALENYVKMCADGTQPKTFEEFYKYWTKQVSASYDKVLFSDELSRLAGNMVDEMSRFKIAYDKLCESYLKFVPVPAKSDMDALYKSVYELKKELRALKKEMATDGKHDN